MFSVSKGDFEVKGKKKSIQMPFQNVMIIHLQIGDWGPCTISIYGRNLHTPPPFPSIPVPVYISLIMEFIFTYFILHLACLDTVLECIWMMHYSSLFFL